MTALTDTEGYVSGSTDRPLLDKTIGHMLSEAVLAYSERTPLAVRHRILLWSVRELEERVNQVAVGLEGKIRFPVSAIFLLT